MSLTLFITFSFIVVIVWIAVVGFWPFVKAFGLSGLWSLWAKTGQLRREMEKVLQTLPHEKTITEQRQAFTRQYHKIKQYFDDHQSVFSHPWTEFTEQLIEPSETEPAFQNSFRPENFFTLEYFLKQKNLNLKLLGSMPGILVGLGVLGTFIGLSISLIPALSQLESDPSSAVKYLMEGAGIAFFTSVVGLLCSLIFNVISDKKISVLQNQLNKFNSLLEKSLKFVTEEHLLTMYLEESRQQGKYLSSMDEKIALKIGDIIGESVQKMGEKIQSSISQSHQNISEKFLENIVQTMEKGMGGFLKTQMETTEKTLTSLQDNIPPLIARLENSQKQSTETAKTLMEQLSTSSKDNQTKINQSFTETIQGMKELFEGIHKI